MNITIKISDDLAKRARHEADDDGLSLSCWVSKLINEELTGKSTSKSLLEALGNEKLAELECEFPRTQSTSGEVHFQ